MYNIKVSLIKIPIIYHKINKIKALKKNAFNILKYYFINKKNKLI
jgi:hypothetical protein